VTMEKPLEVRDDPRLEVDPAVRTAWIEAQKELDALLQSVMGPAREAGQTQRRAEAGDLVIDDPEIRLGLDDLSRELNELTSRIARLRGGVSRWVGPLTEQENQQWLFLEQMAGDLLFEWQALSELLPGG